MAEIVVHHEGGDRFSVVVRQHTLLVDQPDGLQGQDLGPTPTELFVAGLASCVGYYAERFLQRHDVPVDGLKVLCRFEMSKDGPSRVASVALEVLVPAHLTESQTEALRRVAEHCTVHNSIRTAPDIVTSVSAGRQAA
jgi:uncharacterized OsmC-like protein